jgi:hypothetical protein
MVSPRTMTRSLRSARRSPAGRDVAQDLGDAKPVLSGQPLRTGDQSENGQGARPHSAVITTPPRRRGSSSEIGDLRRSERQVSTFRAIQVEGSGGQLWVKLRRTGTAAALPVNPRQRKCLPTGRHSRSVPIADMANLRQSLRSSAHDRCSDQASVIADASYPTLGLEVLRVIMT